MKMKSLSSLIFLCGLITFKILRRPHLPSLLVPGVEVGGLSLPPTAGISFLLGFIRPQLRFQWTFPKQRGKAVTTNAHSGN